MKKAVNICWFRRDLRLHDHHALFASLNSDVLVLPIFIFDKNILSELPTYDRRVDFIFQALQSINEKLKIHNASLRIFHEKPLSVFKTLCEKYDIKGVYTNHDYEPYAIKRDDEIKSFLNSKHIHFYTYKDQVIFEKNEILKEDEKPYVVYTPYSKKWKLLLQNIGITFHPSEKYLDKILKNDYDKNEIEELNQIGFLKTNIQFAIPLLEKSIPIDYEKTRDIPMLEGTSKLSIHLRFGTISIRELLAIAKNTNEKFLNELIWREFYMQILWHYPCNIHNAFKKEYDLIQWQNNESHFEKWCNGNTGYPIVDAGMRQLNNTGWMHNRVRMITASFLTKHLLIDWRWGEAYFAKKLNDFELAINNGSWQWCAGCGVDAAPYFRIFNPYIQTQKFDTAHIYIKKWVPEYQELNYAKPIVQHEEARKKCLSVYKSALEQSQ